MPTDVTTPLATREAVHLLQHIWHEQPPAPDPSSLHDLIEVSSATRRIAYAYERFRNTLEPEEEDILRRKAISRILHRRLLQDRPDFSTATALIQELIRAHYIAPVPKAFAGVVAQDINRAQTLTDLLTRDQAEWFMRLVAVSIDRKFHTHEQAEAVVQLMYNDVYRRLSWIDASIPDEERAAQLYLACHRTLFSVDDFELQYTYFIKRFPEWNKTGVTAAELSKLAEELPEFYAHITQVVHHPSRFRLIRLLRPHAVPYRILWDMLNRRQSIWDNQEAIHEAAKDAILARIQHIRTRMNRRAWHSIFFLFFTKLTLTLFIELPYELFVLGQLHLLALSTNVVFHPLLLFFSSTWARVPGNRNTQAITDQVVKIITGEGELPTVVIDQPRRYGPITWTIFALAYAGMFVAIFWGLFLILDRLQFSLVAMFLFIVFLGLVSFLSLRIRRSIEDIRLLPPRDSLFGALINFISLPILEFGRWLAENIAHINVILFIMDRVLEAPFKILIDVVEDWFSFVRDRKEEIV